MKVKNELWILLILPIVYILIYNSKLDLIGPYLEEDGFIESIGALAFFVASVLFLYLFFTMKEGYQFNFFGKSTNKNIYFLLLGILFFLAFGEEISWGQRIFGWSTPESFGDINAQKETNIHNLWVFQGYKKDGTPKSFIENMLNFNRLFNIFWFLFCFVIPVLSLASKKFKNLIHQIGIPQVPLWIGAFFMFNYIVFFIGVNINHVQDPQTGLNYTNGFDETKETFYAIGFALLSFYFLRNMPVTKSMK